MSKEKHEQLIKEGKLLPDGTRPPTPPPPEATDEEQVVAEAEVVAAEAVDPSRKKG